MGREYEGANRRYIVINIAPSVDFERIVRFMIENQVQFEYADPTYSEIHGEE